MPKKYPKVRSRNGVHTYRYDVINPETGERIQKETKGYATAKEAFQAGLRIEEEIRNGIFIEESTLRVSEWSDKWIKLYSATGKTKQRTIDIRSRTLQIINKEIGGLRLKDVTPLVYQSLLNNLKNRGLTSKTEKTGYSKNSLDIIHSTCRMMFSKAVRVGLLKSDPTEGSYVPSFALTVDDLESGSEVPKYLEKEELAKLLKAAYATGDLQKANALFVLSYTGLRIGELCALRTTDVDYINKKISVTKTLYHVKGIAEYRLDTPKTRSSIRKVDIGDSVIKVLKKQESWRNEFKMSRRDEFYGKEDFLFVNEALLPGYPMSPVKLQLFMKSIVSAQGLPPSVSPHSLRHTYTSLMAEAGVELTSIQKLLGHKKNAITEQVYLHVTKSKRREAVDKLDALMDGLL